MKMLSSSTRMPSTASSSTAVKPPHRTTGVPPVRARPDTGQTPVVRGSNADLHELFATLLLFLAPELPAGGVDVAPAALAHVRVHAAAAQDGLEGHDVVGLRPLVRQRLDLVVAEEVHVRAQRAAQAHELPRVLRAVVDAREQDVLER